MMKSACQSLSKAKSQKRYHAARNRLNAEMVLRCVFQRINAVVRESGRYSHDELRCELEEIAEEVGKAIDERAWNMPVLIIKSEP